MAASHNVMSNNNFSFKALIKNSWIAWGYPRYLLLQAYGPRSWPGQGAYLVDPDASRSYPGFCRTLPSTSTFDGKYRICYNPGVYYCCESLMDIQRSLRGSR